MPVYPFCSHSHFRAVCALIPPVSTPPPPLTQRAQEDVHPLVPTACHSFMCTRGARGTILAPPPLLVYTPAAPAPLPLTPRVVTRQQLVA